MTRSQRVRRSGALVLAAASVAAFLTAAAPAAWATPAPARGEPGVSGARAAVVIECEEVDVDLPNVFGRDCGSRGFGPISDFTVVDRDSNQKYRCENGWAEGGLWIRGDGCREIQS
ncbi:hypothetical protein PUR49_01255 [Streptomyces sp. BE147]|uniref:hypothetical protein n=1 Tax=Streptomyces sp. BE147 TaxID=3002524 RepID=UPI002E772CF7|nr:hypothetical protein [Streptomyces sp. BE147]MEE1735177.1 hypothetical protein [Streptomyces sp. BE147]